MLCWFDVFLVIGFVVTFVVDAALYAVVLEYPICGSLIIEP